jgi:nucleoside-diphosphate-sugar epimerase
LEKKKVIITGGAGLLGSAVTHQLVEEGTYLPVVMGRSDNPKRILDIMDEVIYEQGDVSDLATLERVIETHRPHKIYHFATVLGDACEKDVKLATKVNVDGFVDMMELVRKYEVNQVLFSSSMTTFAESLESKTIHDRCLQRPGSYYGVTKLFQEGTGRFFKKKYGVDFRAIRYPAIIGPGSRAGGFVSYTSDIINYALKGEPYTVQFESNMCLPLLHTKDAARAIIDLGNAPIESIKEVCYLINGVRSPPEAGELAKMVQKKIPSAKTSFETNQEWQSVLEASALLIDDKYAKNEWGWKPTFDTYEKIIDDFIEASKK